MSIRPDIYFSLWYPNISNWKAHGEPSVAIMVFDISCLPRLRPKTSLPESSFHQSILSQTTSGRGPVMDSMTYVFSELYWWPTLTTFPSQTTLPYQRHPAKSKWMCQMINANMSSDFFYKVIFFNCPPNKKKFKCVSLSLNFTLRGELWNGIHERG